MQREPQTQGSSCANPGKPVQPQNRSAKVPSGARVERLRTSKLISSKGPTNDSGNLKVRINIHDLYKNCWLLS